MQVRKNGNARPPASPFADSSDRKPLSLHRVATFSSVPIFSQSLHPRTSGALVRKSAMTDQFFAQLQQICFVAKNSFFPNFSPLNSSND